MSLTRRTAVPARRMGPAPPAPVTPSAQEPRSAARGTVATSARKPSLISATSPPSVGTARPCFHASSTTPPARSVSTSSTEAVGGTRTTLRQKTSVSGCASMPGPPSPPLRKSMWEHFPLPPPTLLSAECQVSSLFRCSFHPGQELAPLGPSSTKPSRGGQGKVPGGAGFCLSTPLLPGPPGTL